MKPNNRFEKLSKFIKQKNAPQVMAEKQSPQDMGKVSLKPEEVAEQVVEKRKELKKGKLPVKTTNLYDDL